MVILPSVRQNSASTGTLLALDPGARYPAVALFAQGRLTISSRISLPAALGRMQGLETGERCRQIADIIAGWVLGKTDHVDTTVVEWPKVYRVGRSKGDPNDLLLLAALVGGVSCRLGARTVSPVPSEWIGSLPKTTTGDPLDSPRGRLIWRLLDASERAAVVVSHDSLDSAGLGLWALGRLGKVFPGTV